MELTNDKSMNPALREEVQGLRGGIIGQANTNPLPDRFSVESHPDKPMMIITDSVTNTSHNVSLFAYGEVRKALSAFFS